MAPIGRRYTSETPHFFKMIPRKFVSEFGSEFGNSIVLRVPGGKLWKLGLTKCNKEIWLQTGLREFMDCYSIVCGYFLVFRYEGSSSLDVTIFDHTATEIEYFYPSSNIGEFSDSEDDVSVEILEQNITRPKKRGETPDLFHHRPAKTRKTNLSDNTEEHLKCHQSSQQEFPGALGKFNSAAKKDGESTSTYRRTPESTNFQQTAEEKSKCPQVACSTHDYPSFTITIFPSHFLSGYVGVPNEFVRKYLDKYEGPVIIHTSDGRKWSLRFVNESARPKGRSRFSTGWLDFARDNQLKTTDVCVFELIKGKEISFKVVISQSNEKEDRDVIKQKKFGSKSQIFNIGIEDDESIEILEQNSRSLQRQRAKKKYPQVPGPTHDYPFFTITIGHSHLQRKGYLGVPSVFARKYLDKYAGPIILHVSDGRKWPLRFINEVSRPQGQSRLISGWPDFVLDNQLKITDVCVFELIKGKEISFKVVISRSSEKKNRPVIKPKKIGGKSQMLDTDSEDDESIKILDHNPRSLQRQTGKEKSPQVAGPTYDNLFFTTTIGQSHLQRRGFLKCDDPIVLHISDGRKWSLRYTHQAKCFQGQSRLTGNDWGVFTRDNKLKIGDICQFELEKGNVISFKVVISRFNEEENCAKNVNVMKSTAAPLSNEEKAMVAKRAGAFRMTKHFFVVKMQPSYVSGKCGVNVPYKFVKQYLNPKHDEITVIVLGGKKWTLGYSSSDKLFGKSILYCGWKDFSKDNNLKVGDVCRFELIDGIENSFRVLISPSGKDDHCKSRRV
ncbi:hypothetical protein ACFE04_002922 [Oxalis oulophora]